MRKVRFLRSLIFLLMLIFSWCAIFSFFNQAPVKPHTPSPSHDSTEVLTNVTLSWQCSDPEGDILRYDIYFGTASTPPLVKANYTTSNYVPELLLGNRTYYWRIVAKDSKGPSLPEMSGALKHRTLLRVNRLTQNHLTML